MALFSSAVFAAGRMSAQRMHPQTMHHLYRSMHGEAFAHAKYLLYAQHARASGHPEIAQAFEDAAKTELGEHFAEEAELAHLVGTDAENLRDAIHGENYESTHMYPQFARMAAAAGDKAAAHRFQEVGQDEAKHRDRFQALLNKLQAARTGMR